MQSNERLLVALNKILEITPNIEIGKFIRYISSVSDLAYMLDDDIAHLVETEVKMARLYPDHYKYNFTAKQHYYLDYASLDDDSPEKKLYEFTKENEQISYDRYKEKVEGRVFIEFTEQLDMSDFLRRFTLEFVDAEEFKGITVINHRDTFLNEFPITYRYMGGYMVARKGDKYIAQHMYLVKIPCFGELLESLLYHCKEDYDEFFGIVIDWWDLNVRFTDYTNHIMYGLNYNRKEKIVEIYNEHQTIEKFHEYMQKANKILSSDDKVIYDDGSFLGE